VLTALDKTMLSAMKDLKGETVRGAGFADMPLSADLFHKDAPPMLHTSDGPLAAFDALIQARRAGHGGDDFFRNRQG
jgi:hypothetical protein